MRQLQDCTIVPSFTIPGKTTMKEVETWQAKKVKKPIGEQFRYLHRLKTRLEKVGFLVTDPLDQNVKKAYDAVHPLHVELHYLSIGHGVGRKPWDRNQSIR